MAVLFQAGYTLPGGDEPLTHARIAHSGNWLSGGTANAFGTATGFFADGPLNSLTYEKWKPNAVNDTWAYEHTSSVEANYICIAAHTFGSSGATLSFQYDAGAGYTNIQTGYSPADDSPIMFIFDPITAADWRIQVTAYTTAPVMGVFKVGTALQMQRPLYGGHSPMRLSRRPQMRSNNSATGEFLGRTKVRSFMETTYSWSHLTASWVRDNWRPFQTALETEPFFIAWRPVTFPNDVAFGYVNEMPIPQNMGIKDYMAVDMRMTARAYD